MIMKKNICSAIALILVSIILLGTIYFNKNTVDNINISAEGDTNIYHILEIVKAPKYTQLSFLYKDTFPGGMPNDNELLYNIHKDYPIFKLSGTYTSTLVSEPSGNITTDIFNASPNAKQIGYFAKHDTPITNNNYKLNVVNETDINTKLDFYTYANDTYTSVTDTTDTDEEGNTITIPAYTVAQYFKVKNTDIYQPISLLYSVAKVTDGEETVNNLVYFTKDNSGAYSFYESVTGFKYTYNNEEWVKSDSITNADIYSTMINEGITTLIYSNDTELENAKFIGTRTVKEIVREEDKTYTYENANLITKLVPEGKTPSIIVKTVDALTESDINTADLIYFNSIETDNVFSNYCTAHTTLSGTIVNFSNLSENNADLIYNRIKNREVNIIYDSTPSDITNFINTESTTTVSPYTKLYFMCNALYPNAFKHMIDTYDITSINTLQNVKDIYRLLPSISSVFGLSYANFGIDNIACNKNIVEHNVCSINMDTFFIDYFSNNKTIDNLNNDESVVDAKYGFVDLLHTLIFNPKQPILHNDNIRILEIEPCQDFLSETYWNTRIIGIDPYYTNKVDLTQMTTREFIGITEDLTSNYDIIYFGSNTGTMNVDTTALSSSAIIQKQSLVVTANTPNTFLFSDIFDSIYPDLSITNVEAVTTKITVNNFDTQSFTVTIPSAFDSSGNYIGEQTIKLTIKDNISGNSISMNVGVNIPIETNIKTLRVNDTNMYTYSDEFFNPAPDLRTEYDGVVEEPDSFDTTWTKEKISSDELYAYYKDGVMFLKGSGTVNNTLKTILSTDSNGIKKVFCGKDSVIKFPNNASGYFSYLNTLEYIDCSTMTFTNCTNLNSLFAHDPKLKRIDKLYIDAVATCTDLCKVSPNLVYVDLHLKRVTDIQGMFWISNADNLLRYINTSDWDLSNVTDMNNTFCRCKYLTYLDVSNWDVHNVTNFQQTFYCCQNLVTLDVSNWDVSKVTNISHMFEYASKLEYLDMSKWNPINLNYTDSFANGTNLYALDTMSWQKSNNLLRACWILNNNNKVKYLNIAGIDANTETEAMLWGAMADLESVIITPIVFKDGANNLYLKPAENYYDLNTNADFRSDGKVDNIGTPHVIQHKGEVENNDVTIFKTDGDKTINFKEIFDNAELPSNYTITDADLVYCNLDSQVTYTNKVLTVTNGTGSKNYYLVFKLHLNNPNMTKEYYKYISYVVHIINISNSDNSASTTTNLNIPTVYNDTTMNGLIYTHIGDRIATCPGQYNNEPNPAKVSKYAAILHNYPNLAYATAPYNGVWFWNKFRLSGNDILAKQVDKLKTFINNGKVVIVNNILVDTDKHINTKTIDSTSNLYKFLSTSDIKIDSDIIPSSITNLYSKAINITMTRVPTPYIDTLVSNVNINIDKTNQKVVLSPKDNTTEGIKKYNEVISTLNNVNEYSFDSLGITTDNVDSLTTSEIFSLKGDTLEMSFTINGNVNKTYGVSLYFDTVVDSNLYDYEEIHDISLFDNTTNSPVMNNNLVAGHNYTLSKTLTDENYGCLHWYLKVYVDNSFVVSDGYTYRKTAETHDIYILCILPTGGNLLNIASNSANAFDNTGYNSTSSKKYRQYLDKLTDIGFNLNVVTLNAAQMDNYMTLDIPNDTYYLEIPFTLNDGTVKNIKSDYIDMLVLGFSNGTTSTYTQNYAYIEDSVASLYLVSDFLEQKKPVLFTSSIIDGNGGFTNAGADDAKVDGGNNSTFSRFFRARLGMDRYGAWNYNTLPTLSDMQTPKSKSTYIHNNAPYTKYNITIDHNTVNGDLQGLLSYCSTISNEKINKEDIAGATDTRLCTELQVYHSVGDNKSTVVPCSGDNKYFYIRNNLIENIKYNGIYCYSEHNRASKVNRGQINTFPYFLGDTLELTEDVTLKAPAFQLDLENDSVNVWYCCDTTDDFYTAPLYKNNHNDCRNNYYAYNYDSAIYCNIQGKNSLTDDEAKLLLNCLCTSTRPEAIESKIKCTNETATNIDDTTYIYIDYDNTADISNVDNLIEPHNLNASTKEVKIFYTVENDSVVMNKHNYISLYNTSISDYVTVYDASTNTPITPRTINDTLVYDIGDNTEFYIIVAVDNFEKSNNLNSDETYNIEIVSTATTTYGFSGKSISAEHHTYIVKRGFFNLH